MEEEDEGEDYSMKPGLCPFSVGQLCGLNDTRSCVADDECDGDAKCCLTSSCGSVCAEVELKEINNDDLDFDRSPSSKLHHHQTLHECESCVSIPGIKKQCFFHVLYLFIYKIILQLFLNKERYIHTGGKTRLCQKVFLC